MRLGVSKANVKIRYLIFFVCISAIVLYMAIRLETSFSAMVKAYGQNTAVAALNNSAYNVFSKVEETEFSKIVNNDGKLTMTTNSARINMVNAEFSDLLQKEILSAETMTVKIPLGAMTGIALFSGTGPKIPVKIKPVSVVRTDISEKFESAGINQVHHKVSINVDVMVSYVAYLFNESEKISVTIPVSDTVIVGDVPHYYANGEMELEAQ